MDRRMKIELFLLDNLIWVILGCLFLINIFITPKFFTYTNMINILYHSAILSMLVLGQGLTLMTGHLDLSIESTLAFAPGIAILFATKWVAGLNPIITIILTFFVGALVGLFNGYCITSIGINPFLQTLSMLIILRGIILYLIPFAIFNLDKSYIFLGNARTFGNIPVSIFVMLGIFILSDFILKRTSYGRYFLATGGNPRASYISGINTRKIIISAFMLSGVLAAIAGLLAAGRQSAVNNSMGDGMVLLSFAGAILGGVSVSGGKGTPIGMLGGALFLGTISNSLTLLGVNVFIVYACQGLLIFLALVLDRAKAKIQNFLFQRERIRKLKASLK
ncbi:MAG TPA: ABC transporter permease [Candidatus Atribacteria bacterium]|nr:ABC transporter permease [Candidatus Atribacteria bacterium]